MTRTDGAVREPVRDVGGHQAAATDVDLRALATPYLRTEPGDADGHHQGDPDHQMAPTTTAAGSSSKALPPT